MATEVVLGPAPPPSTYSRASISSSSQASPATSSESPKSATRLSFAVRYADDRPSHDVIPKIEELDEDDLDMDDVKPSPTEDGTITSPTRGVVKRPRGRPRKHPATPPSISNKPPKGRSKTGCITCRRRKKKCDETKPHCTWLDSRQAWEDSKGTMLLTKSRSALPEEQCPLRRVPTKRILEKW